MPKIAVHLHLYYCSQWEEIRAYLANIADYPYHLFVTLVEDNPALIQQIKAFHPQTSVYVLENRGYDVGPFVYVLHQINLDDYDLIFKIHTKGKTGCDTLLNHRYVNRKYWSDLLFAALISSKNLFLKNLDAFAQQPDLGMIGSKYLITSSPKNSKEVRDRVIEILKDWGFSAPQNITFVAGTMFIIRANLLKKIKENFAFSDFTPTDGTVRDGTLAHVLERLFGCLVIAEGYKINGYDRNFEFENYGRLMAVKHFLFQRKITRSNHLLIKVLKLPIYHRKLI